MKRSALLAALTLALCAGSTALAQETAAPAPAKAPAAKSLKVGDAAPALNVTTWVKGEPVTSFEKGRTYVVEFWATWCGPCIASMPHLTELQAEFKDKGLVIVGVSAKDKMNTLEAVQAMVKDKGDTMGYTVAFDADRATYTSFMEAAGQNGIPCSFVVDKAGKIAFIGHPLFLDAVLGKVTAGTWDAAKDPAAIEALQKDFFAVYEAETPADQIKRIEAIEKNHPKLAGKLATMKFQAQMESGDFTGASKTGNAVVDAAIKSKNSMDLNQIAWAIVDPQGNVAKKDLDLAFKAADAANTITGGKDAAILDTLARVHFLKGNKAKAIELQEKAVANATGPMKADLQKALDEYKAAK